MTDVVSVIGDLERVLQATTSGAQLPGLCVNCAPPSASVASAGLNPSMAATSSFAASSSVAALGNGEFAFSLFFLIH